MTARGKRFESNFENSLELHNEKFKDNQVAFLRLYDPGHGFSGVKNPCDYIVYKYPNIFYFELKEAQGNTINFSAAITENQFDKLKEVSKIEGVTAGVIFKFTDTEEAYFVHIDLLQKHPDIVKKGKNKGTFRWSYQLKGNKSLSPELALQYGVYLNGIKKRVNWEYHIGAFLERLQRLYNK